MFRFIHAADIHLDSPLKGLESYEDAPVDEIRNATRRAFDNLVTLAIEEEVRFVLLVGDLYDGDWKDYNTGLFFTERMGRLKRQGIRVFMVSGNHDAQSRISRHLQPPDNVTTLSARKPETILLDDTGAAIHGQGYASRAITRNLAQHYPQYHPGYFNIGLLHTGLNGREGHEPYAPCSLDDLKSKGYDYWALGHVHQREVVSKDPWILFPGNLQGRHIRETGPKGASLVTVENNRVTDVTHHDLDVLRFCIVRINLSQCHSLDAIHEPVLQALEAQQAQADGRILAVRLEFTGESPLHMNLLSDAAPLTESFRGITAGLGDMWLEKVLFKTFATVLPREMPGEETPLHQIMAAVDQLKWDPEELQDPLSSQIPDIAALKSKLPPDLLGSDDPLIPNRPDKIADLLNDVKALLAARLSRQVNLP
jgi:DNA repair exonuclease SbcCD nuclease subunit